MDISNVDMETRARKAAREFTYLVADPCCAAYEEEQNDQGNKISESTHCVKSGISM
jgi:hypothetical protein